MKFRTKGPLLFLLILAIACSALRVAVEARASSKGPEANVPERITGSEQDDRNASEGCILDFPPGRSLEVLFHFHPGPGWEVLMDTPLQIFAGVDGPTKVSTGTDVTLLLSDEDIGDLKFLGEMKTKCLSAIFIEARLPATFLDTDGLRTLRRLKGVKRFGLDNVRVHDEVLLDCLPADSLESIRLARLPITDKSMRALKDLKHLRELVLEGIDISDKGLQFLEYHRRLEELRISKIRIRGAGIKYLAKIPTLKRIEISENLLSRDAFTSLAEIKSLEELTLRSVDIDDRGAAALCDMRTLKSLYVWNAVMSDKAVQRLKEKLPNCKIYIDAKPSVPVNPRTGVPIS